MTNIDDVINQKINNTRAMEALAKGDEMTIVLTEILSSIGLTVILFAGIWLLIAVALNESKDTLNRIFAALASSILIFVFCYVIFIVITK